MHRIDTPTALPDKFGQGKNGFTRGNPQTGQQATALDDDYCDSIQEEICTVIESAGLALNKATRNQLIAALNKMYVQQDQNGADIPDKALFRQNVGLVKQTGLFDATAGSLLINGAWGWGGRGEDFEKSEADFLSWARNINNGSRVFRNTLNTKYTQPYGASLLFRSVDTWGVLSVGYGNQDGVKISGGNASGSNTRDHYLWTDKNLPNPATLDTTQTIDGVKTFRTLYVHAISGNTGIELGRIDAASSTFIDFHTSGNGSGHDYDARILAGGGNASTGQGTLNIISNSLQWNGFVE